MHQQNGAEGHKNVFAEKQADVIGGGRHGADTIAHRVGEQRIARFGSALGHGRDQRAHHRRLAAQAGQSERRTALAHEQVKDQQAPGGGGRDARHAGLRVFPQAEPFQQADGGERQQIDQRQVARLDERGAQGCQQLLDIHRSGKARDGAGGHDHQHRVGAQEKSHDNDRDAEQRPQIHSGVHGMLRRYWPENIT